MGYYMSLYSVADESADRLVTYPGQADDTLQHAVLRVAGIAPDPRLHCYLDKAWHALHWLLARVYGHPLTFLCNGGRVLADTRYAIRLHDAAEVGAIQAALALVSDDEIRMAYDAEALTRARIYPDIIWRRDGNDAREYVLANFARMRVTLTAASVSDRHIVVVGGFRNAPDSPRLCTRILGTQRMSEEDYAWMVEPEWDRELVAHMGDDEPCW